MHQKVSISLFQECIVTAIKACSVGFSDTWIKPWRSPQTAETRRGESGWQKALQKFYDPFKQTSGG